MFRLGVWEKPRLEREGMGGSFPAVEGVYFAYGWWQRPACSAYGDLERAHMINQVRRVTLHLLVKVVLLADSFIDRAVLRKSRERLT